MRATSAELREVASLDDVVTCAEDGNILKVWKSPSGAYVVAVLVEPEPEDEPEPKSFQPTEAQEAVGKWRESTRKSVIELSRTAEMMAEAGSDRALSRVEAYNNVLRFL